MLTASFYEVLAAGCGCLFVVMFGAFLALRRYDKRKWHDSFINRSAGRNENKRSFSLEDAFRLAIKPFIPNDVKLNKTKKFLAGAGYEETEPETVYMMGLISSVVLSIIAFAMFFTFGKWFTVAAVVIGMALGSRLPVMVLEVMATRRYLEKQAGVLKFAESMTSAVEAGLTLYSAITKVAKKQNTALAQEFNRAVEEMESHAKSFDESMFGIVERVGGENIKLLVEGIIHSRRSGSSVTNVLYALCDTIRNDTKVSIRETVEKAKIKNLIIQFTLQFPAYAYIIAGPALIEMMEVLE